jgi:hypothetical protein
LAHSQWPKTAAGRAPTRPSAVFGAPKRGPRTVTGHVRLSLASRHASWAMRSVWSVRTWRGGLGVDTECFCGVWCLRFLTLALSLDLGSGRLTRPASHTTSWVNHNLSARSAVPGRWQGDPLSSLVLVFSAHACPRRLRECGSAGMVSSSADRPKKIQR